MSVRCVYVWGCVGVCVCVFFSNLFSSIFFNINVRNVDECRYVLF